jgi:hypothetical protein
MRRGEGKRLKSIPQLESQAGDQRFPSLEEADAEIEIGAGHKPPGKPLH